MSSDPDLPLSALCSICRLQPPQYRCPRCLTRTCSLRCATLHKKRAPCNGIRDPSKYIPPHELATEKGIDHDYNYLTSLERVIETGEKNAQERGVDLSIGEANGHPDGRPGKGGKQLETAIQKAGVRLRRAPKGIARQKENNTRWARTPGGGGKVLWTVEFILSGPSPKLSGDMDGQGDRKAKRRRICDVAEALPVGEAFLNAFRGRSKNKEMRPPKKRKQSDMIHNEKPNTQKEDDQSDAPQLTQSPHESWHDYSFYLHVPGLPTPLTILQPLTASTTLTAALHNRLILEFPTIYVFPSVKTLPSQPSSSPPSQSPSLPRALSPSNTLLPEGFATAEAYFAVGGKKGDEPGGGGTVVEAGKTLVEEVS